MNINKIFSKFENDNETEDNDSIDGTHPYILSGLICKVINNLDNYILDLYTQENRGKIDSKKYKQYYETCRQILFEDCYEKLISIDINSVISVESILRHPKNNFSRALHIMLSHYEKLEEYGKCKEIKSFEDNYKKIVENLEG